MADQIFTVNSGFFDAVNEDRTYSADQMNRPYKRIVSNGVFATQQGEASDDLHVISAGAGMGIICKAGEGLFGDKWFESPSDIPITVPSNTGTQPRKDSVIVQVDKRISGRVSSIVYRTGTPAADPAPPAINTIENVIEYRLATIRVAAGTNSITDELITDMRGSAECPWVTSLVMQVDTSTLFTQWQDAYQRYYDDATDDFETYTEEQRQAWQDFLDNCTSDITVATNVLKFTSYYVTASDESTIPIRIETYDPETDVLQVYVNGLLAVEGVRYSVNAAGTNIELVTAVMAGTAINFVVFKSVISAGIASTTTMIENLNDKLAGFMTDSGWIGLTLENGAQPYDSNSTPALRCVGNRVYIRGAIKGLTQLSKTICTLPVPYSPERPHTFAATATVGSNVMATVTIQITPKGYMKLLATTAVIPAAALISVQTCFLAPGGYNTAAIYNYKGSVEAYENLPQSGMKAGDIYTVNTADNDHGIKAGDDVVWNGERWEVLDDSIPSSDIDAIINGIH